MARPREFDEEQVLDCAMDVFRTRGYEAASLSDLLRAMRISKSSFYDTFGSKRALYRRSLERFAQTQALPTRVDLDSNAPVQSVVAELCGVVFDGAADQGRGCMLGRAAMELSHSHPDVRRRAAAGLGSLEKTLRRFVERRQASGEIPTDRDARVLARSLMATLYGLEVLGHARVGRGVLRDVVAATQEMFD